MATTMLLPTDGQVIIPEDVRAALGVLDGGGVTFIVEDGEVSLVNSAIYAMKSLRKEMEGEAARAGIASDDDVMALVKELRSSEE